MLCLDDPIVQELLPRIGRRVRTYGLSPQADTRAEQIETEGFTMRFHALHAGRSLGSVHLRLPGLHNVRNALAAIAVGLELEVPFAAIQRALEGFEGVERRFEICGEVHDILVVNDYAHHPTEIRATLAAAREGGRRRLLAVFQPHRYTRTQDLFDELASAFHDADVLVLTEIYPAGEAKIAGVEGRRLADAVRRHGHREVHWVPEKTQLVGSVQALARAGDLVLFLGAGDIGREPERLLAELSGGNGD